MVRYEEATDIGLVRELNEDSLLCRPPGDFVVADGMGGHAAGEIASRIFTDIADKYLSEYKEISTENDMQEMFQAGNYGILTSIEKHPERFGMGTTATMLHVAGSKAMWAHVGDSRLYLLRRSSLQQITSDHTYVNTLLAMGSITPQEAENHPDRNKLLRAVGAEETLQVDTGSFQLEQGDIMLLCSDGLTNMVTEPAIQTVLEAKQCKNRAEALVECAKAAGGKDNISIIVVEYYEE